MMSRYPESSNSRVPLLLLDLTGQGEEVMQVELQEDSEQPTGELPGGAGEVTGDKPS